MASTLESFQDLNLSRDEVERIGEALKDKEFRKLLGDYIEEIRDPDNRKLYEEEVTQLEKERGMDIKFINPTPGYVIKTSVNGAQKAFINVASNAHIGRPTSTPMYQEGHRGLQWSLPHTLSPPKDDYDSKRVRCIVYDVVFHPDTLRLAKSNKQFKNLVNSTACDSVEKNFDVKLDQKNLKFPNILYKGVDHPSIIRTPSKTAQPPKSEEEQKFLDELFARLPPPKSNLPSPKQETARNQSSDDSSSKYTTPKYVIKHRTLIDMQEFTYDRDAKENVAIPKELVVEVLLPMLGNSEGVALDVTEKTIKLTSETPAKYKLNITLPYAVNQELGNAKFEKDCKKLVITLPVIRNKHFLITDVNSIEDSGVDSDHGSPTLNCALIEDSKQLNNNLIDKSNCVEENYDFFDSSIDYTLPEHFCQLEKENLMHFTFKVKNVNSSSIKHMIIGNTTLLIKFTSISTGFFPIHYGIILKISEGHFATEDVEIEAWDNNVIAQINLVQINVEVTSYLYGSNRDQLIESFIDNKSQNINANLHEKISVKDDQKTINKSANNTLGTDSSELINKNNLQAQEEIKLNSTQVKNDYLHLLNDNKNNKYSAKNVSSNNNNNNIKQEEQVFNSVKTDCLKVKENNNFNTGNFELKLTTKAVDINHCVKTKVRKSSSQCSSSPSSSYDDQSSSCSYSCSPVKNFNRCKSILKQRMRATRSISESGLDDAICCIGESLEIDSCCHSVEEEGVIEEEESDLAVSVGSTKKTVRFSENISQKLFRCNSSILGQKKKNQRKSRNKKRAQERRHSESEICDSSAGNVACNDSNTGDIKTEQETEINENCKDTQFDLDM